MKPNSLYHWKELGRATIKRKQFSNLGLMRLQRLNKMIKKISKSI